MRAQSNTVGRLRFFWGGDAREYPGTVCGGGRYNGLVEQLDGPLTPGIGFGLGIERLIMVLENLGISFPEQKKLDLFVISIGEKADPVSTKIVHELRTKGISADKDHLKRSIKAQFKYADKLNSRYTAVIGDDEITSNSIVLKDMSNSTQEKLCLDTFTKDFFDIIK